MKADFAFLQLILKIQNFLKTYRVENVFEKTPCLLHTPGKLSPSHLHTQTLHHNPLDFATLLDKPLHFSTLDTPFISTFYITHHRQYLSGCTSLLKSLWCIYQRRRRIKLRWMNKWIFLLYSIPTSYFAHSHTTSPLIHTLLQPPPFISTMIIIETPSHPLLYFLFI